MNGLSLGIVEENYDAKHPGMIKISLPGFEGGSNETFWALIAAPYAGKAYGMYFLPEVGDMVVIGFVDGDSQLPIVLGSFWNKTNPHPDKIVVEKNEQKAIITKGGETILLTDGAEGGIIIKTAAGHAIEISDKDKKIAIHTSDDNNTIVIDQGSKSINIEAADKLNIKSKSITIEGELVLKGPSISLKADGGLSMEGKTVKLQGTSTKISGQTLEAMGTTSVKVESSAMLTLKGSLTKIN